MAKRPESFCYAWIEVNDEGNMRIAILHDSKRPGIVMPLMAATLDLARNQREAAQAVALTTGNRLRLVELFIGDTLDQIAAQKGTA